MRVIRSVAALAATILIVALAAPASAARPRPTPDRTPPTTPTGLQVTAVTTTSISVSWNASSDNVGVTSYVVWYDGGNGVVPATPPTTTATLVGLRPGTSYRVNVQAWDAMYNGSGTASVSTGTVADTVAPTTPSGLTVLGVTASTVQLRWTRGVDESGPAVDEVLVNGGATPNADSTTPAGVFPRPATEGAYVRQLEPSTTYTFTVRSRDASGNLSGPSEAVTATTLPSTDTVAPTTPVLLWARDGGVGACPEELWMEWTAATDDVDGSLLEYEVRVNGAINEIAYGRFWVAYTEVPGDNVVTIVAVDRAGNASAPSNPITVRTSFVSCG